MTVQLDVVGLLMTRGGERYGEVVTQLQHALQCAALARAEHADDDLVLAALLHDVGHLIPGAASDTVDAHHGHRGAVLLRPFVSPRLAWLVSHHVAAKRYLCTVDAHYAADLSPASRRSLELQGGLLDHDARVRLEGEAWLADALRIRRWDDLAKVRDAAVPPLSAYLELLRQRFGPQTLPTD